MKSVRPAVVGLGLLIGLAAALFAPAGAAVAHPLGNFSVNQLGALALYPDRIEVGATVDLAELPTLQDKPAVDASGDGVVDGAERASYAARECAGYAARFAVTVGDRGLQWTVERSDLGYAKGSAGLSTSRLTCRLTGPADLRTPTLVRVVNGYRTDRVGWRELTATGTGVRLVDPPLATGSRAGADLRSYPRELLDSPPDQRTAELRVEPDAAAGAGRPGQPTATAPAAALAGSRAPGIVGGAEDRLAAIVADRATGPLVGVLAVLLALVLGAAHAALPGHGKTVMAAYLAGRRGRARDAVAVGAVVTLTHTGGVLVVGLLLTSVAGLAGQTVLGWLGLASGALIAIVGAGMLGQLRRRARRDNHAHDSSGHHHHHHHDHHHHDHHHHHHHHRPSRLGIAGIGIAGGLVPSPSALVVLLGAVGLGRTLFGVLLVVAYGLGMAGTLTAAGLLLVGLRDRWQRRAPRGARWRGLVARLAAAAPAVTGSLVLLVGVGLAGRAALALT